MDISAYSCILWDVDGTIADASRGMFERLTKTLEHYNVEPQSNQQLRGWMGPPMLESFQLRAGLSLEQAEEAVVYYRSLSDSGAGYAAGVDLYPGVAELVREMRAAGLPQSTASTKPEAQVKIILDHFDLTKEFTALSGARAWPEGRLDGKAFVVEQALKRLAAADADISRPVLIGDRHHDIDGGAVHGIPVIFSAWGFGEPAEAEGSIAIADSAATLRSLLLK